MAGSLNRVMLIGNVGRDPEIRSMPNGDRVANLSIATSETWRDKASGERKEKTEWHRVVIFNDHIVKTVENYVKKGSTLYIEGSLQTRKWADKDGVEKFSTEVNVGKFKGELTMLGGKEASSDAGFSGGSDAGVAGGGRHGRGQDAGRAAAYADAHDDPFGDTVPF